LADVDELEVLSPSFTVTSTNIELDRNITALDTLTVQQQPHTKVFQNTAHSYSGGSSWQYVFWNASVAGWSRGQAIWSPTFNTRFTFPRTGVYLINIQLDIQNLTTVGTDPFTAAPINGYCELALGDFDANNIYYKSTIWQGNDSSTNHFETLNISMNTFIQAGKNWYVFVRFPSVSTDRLVYTRGGSSHSKINITYSH
jgi:hypothetical protein